MKDCNCYDCQQIKKHRQKTEPNPETSKVIRYAKYEQSNSGDQSAILKDGHTMFPQDIVDDLNRKSYLESVTTPLRQQLKQLEAENRDARELLERVTIEDEGCGEISDNTFGKIMKFLNQTK